MSFTDAYRQMFAAVGVHLRDEDGCSDAKINEAEQHLGTKIPMALLEYYQVAGRENRINQYFNRLQKPTNWNIESGHWDIDSDQLIFLEENQWVTYWGVPTAKVRQIDSAVAVGLNVRKQGIQWRPEHDSCFTFLKVMLLWHSSFGAAAKDTAMGFIDGDSARTTLDASWNLVGEIREMRAYQRDEQTVCLVKWEDFVQKRMNLPPWRVHVAAATVDALEQAKASLPAQWAEWP